MKRNKGLLICIGGVPASGKTTAGIALRLLYGEDFSLLIDPEVTRNEVLGRPEFSPIRKVDLTPESTAKTIARMIRKTGDGLQQGKIVIVPSAFILEKMRDRFEGLASVRGVPFHGFWLECRSDALLKARSDLRIKRHRQGVRDLSTVSQVVYQAPCPRPENIRWTEIDAAKPPEMVLEAILKHVPSGAVKTPPNRAKIYMKQRRLG